ncbi:MAG: hypothetical protein QG616_665 [Pseudomonadota bacterium]|nr:hypothetical protein [Pseudomonadota bacterium]MDQ5942580.1 hypothetical protein [Pseudomonadota bacterium]
MKQPVTERAILWPADLQRRYGISGPTRWRYERDGHLPARDVKIGPRSGWRIETIVAHERADSAAA